MSPFLRLQPFIDEQLRDDSLPVHFRTEDGEVAFGYRAQVLPGVCSVYLSVRDAGELRKTQQGLAQLSYTLVRALATRGIIARIDAASNYHNAALDGLLDRLRINNPKDAAGDREHKHHQWLTDDFGVQELREHIVGVMAIMRSVGDSDPEPPGRSSTPACSARTHASTPTTTLILTRRIRHDAVSTGVKRAPRSTTTQGGFHAHQRRFLFVR